MLNGRIFLDTETGMEGRTDDQKANVFERPLVEDYAFVGHDTVCTRQYSHVCPALSP
jgi:hypothetical protein